MRENHQKSNLHCNGKVPTKTKCALGSEEQVTFVRAVPLQCIIAFWAYLQCLETGFFGL